MQQQLAKKNLAACEKRISDFDIKLSTTAKDLSATKEKISKQNKQNDSGKQDKYINGSVRIEIFDIPKDLKEAVPLYPKITKDSLCPVNNMREKS